jgi:maltose O-acetyltransferase
VKVLPVSIGSGAWIGAHSTILSGLNIADSTLVGANSLLNCDTEPLSIYGGVPAKILLKK